MLIDIESEKGPDLVKIEFLVPSDRVGSDKFGHTRKSVKFGPVWQTEPFEN